MSIIETIKSLRPLDDLEREEIAFALDFIAAHDGDVLTRDNLAAHVCSACWVINRDRTKVLMAHHNIYNSYAWLGGHADGDVDIAFCARREITEETGLRDFTMIGDGPLMLALHRVKQHERRGKTVAEHTHINLVYVFEADEGEAVRVQASENSAVAWVPIDELDKYVSDCDKHMLSTYERIIRKLAK